MVLVNFWATSCPSCLAEMPALVESYMQYRDRGFDVIAVTMSYDPPSHVLDYSNRYGLPFPVALDADGTLAMAFGNVQATPTSFIIDGQGNIVQRVVGALDFPALRTFLDKQLGSKTS